MSGRTKLNPMDWIVRCVNLKNSGKLEDWQIEMLQDAKISIFSSETTFNKDYQQFLEKNELFHA